MNTKEFDEVLTYLPDNLRSKLYNISTDIKSDTYEIRLRADKPLVLCGKYGVVFITENYNAVHLCSQELITASFDDINNVIARLCEYSVYAYQDDIANGFITFGNGHRAGLCGTFRTENGKISALRKTESVNIRIARNIPLSIRKICPSLCEKDFRGILVCGAPCSGKTTLLKNLAKELSSAFTFGYMKTVIVDERSELGSDTGINCDVIRGHKKLSGIIHATRVMSPDLVVCDEICTNAEAQEILSCCRTGVRFAVSVHAGEISELFMRKVTSTLISSGFFDYVFFLDKKDFNVNVYKTEELIDEYNCRNNSNSHLICDSGLNDSEREQALYYA